MEERERVGRVGELITFSLITLVVVFAALPLGNGHVVSSAVRGDELAGHGVHGEDVLDGHGVDHGEGLPLDLSIHLKIYHI